MLPAWGLHPARRNLVNTVGIERISKSQVSAMARSLDAMVEAFHNRPLDKGPYCYLWIDALALRSRQKGIKDEPGRIEGVCALIATAVNAEGYREIVGLDVVTSEDAAGWLAFLRNLVTRGLSGVKLVTSLRLPPGPEVGDGSDLELQLAKMQDPFHQEPAHPGSPLRPAVGGDRGALDLRPA